jgi:hypothetical protein
VRMRVRLLISVSVPIVREPLLERKQRDEEPLARLEDERPPRPRVQHWRDEAETTR